MPPVPPGGPRLDDLEEERGGTLEQGIGEVRRRRFFRRGGAFAVVIRGQNAEHPAAAELVSEEPKEYVEKARVGEIVPVLRCVEEPSVPRVSPRVHVLHVVSRLVNRERGFPTVGVDAEKVDDFRGYVHGQVMFHRSAQPENRLHSHAVSRRERPLPVGNGQLNLAQHAFRIVRRPPAPHPRLVPGVAHAQVNPHVNPPRVDVFELEHQLLHRAGRHAQLA